MFRTGVLADGLRHGLHKGSGEVLKSEILPWGCVAMVWFGGRVPRGEGAGFVLDDGQKMKDVDCGRRFSEQTSKRSGACWRVEIKGGH